MPPEDPKPAQGSASGQAQGSDLLGDDPKKKKEEEPKPAAPAPAAAPPLSDEDVARIAKAVKPPATPGGEVEPIPVAMPEVPDAASFDQLFADGKQGEAIRAMLAYNTQMHNATTAKTSRVSAVTTVKAEMGDFYTQHRGVLADFVKKNSLTDAHLDTPEKVRQAMSFAVADCGNPEVMREFAELGQTKHPAKPATGAPANASAPSGQGAGAGTPVPRGEVPPTPGAPGAPTGDVSGKRKLDEFESNLIEALDITPDELQTEEDRLKTAGEAGGLRQHRAHGTEL